MLSSHFDICDIHCPDLIGEEDFLVFQQIREDLVPLGGLREVRLRVNGIDAHFVHIPLDQLAPNCDAIFFLKLLLKTPCAQAALLCVPEVQPRLDFLIQLNRVRRRGFWYVVHA